MLTRIVRRAMILLLSIAASIVAGRYLLDQVESERERRELLGNVEISTTPTTPAALRPEPTVTFQPTAPNAKPIAPTAKKPAATTTTASKATLKKNDDLTIIEGIGPAYARALNAVGILSFVDLAAQKPAELIGKMQARASVERVRDWIKQAKQLSKQ